MSLIKAFTGLARRAAGFIPGGNIAAATLVALRKKQQGSVRTTRSTSIRMIPPSYQSSTTTEGSSTGSYAPSQGGMAMVPMGATGAACPIGFRPNKSTYVTRGGGTSRWPMQIVVHPKGTECVRRRRRHVTNAKALRRAISRVRGFVKIARKAFSLVGHHRRIGRGKAAAQNIEIVRG